MEVEAVKDGTTGDDVKDAGAPGDADAEGVMDNVGVMVIEGEGVRIDERVDEPE